MITNQSRIATQAFAMPMAMPPGTEELYEQLLALADKVGAAYAEAYQQLSASYAQAYQKLALGVGNLQGNLASRQPADWLSAIPSGASATDQLAGIADRTFEIGENMTDMGRRIGLAFVAAAEQVTLAAADCQEQLGAASEVELIKATSTTCAELARKVVRAGASTVREMVADAPGGGPVVDFAEGVARRTSQYGASTGPRAVPEG
jgi:hypothetical protein